jgi:hypothetical protein
VVEHDAEQRLDAVLRRAFWQGWSSAQHANRIPRLTGRKAWRHPKPMLAGDWALRGLGVDPDALEPAERKRLLTVARLDYAARVAGSVWAGARRAR